MTPRDDLQLFNRADETTRFQFDLFAAPEQIVVAPAGAVVHPDRRRMAGQLPRQRKRPRAGDGADVRQLELPLENYARVGLNDDETYRRQHYGYGRDD
jgi:hypothetical protein